MNLPSIINESSLTYEQPSRAIFLKSRRFEDIKYDTERGLLGDYLATTWWPLGDYLVTTWRPLGDHLVTTWLTSCSMKDAESAQFTPSSLLKFHSQLLKREPVVLCQGALSGPREKIRIYFDGYWLRHRRRRDYNFNYNYKDKGKDKGTKAQIFIDNVY